METMKITIDDQQTKELVVRMLHSIKGVNIMQNKRTSAHNPAESLKALSGIWHGREISLSDLRKKAWERSQT